MNVHTFFFQHRMINTVFKTFGQSSLQLPCKSGIPVHESRQKPDHFVRADMAMYLKRKKKNNFLSNFFWYCYLSYTCKLMQDSELYINIHTFWDSLFFVPCDVIQRKHITTKTFSQAHRILSVTFPLEVNDDVLLWVVPINGAILTAPRSYIFPMLPVRDKPKERYINKDNCMNTCNDFFLK